MTSHETDEPEPTMEDLRRQVDALQAMLRQMSGGAVDAVMMPGEDGDELYTLTSADRPYRVIVESMGEAAVTVSRSGVIHYTNQQLATFLGTDREGMVGRDLHDYVESEQRVAMDALLDSTEPTRRGEVSLRGASGTLVPFLVAVTDMDLDGTLVRCVVLTDLTMRKAYERQMVQEVAEAERHRVAQEVNDTIVQGLVAAEMLLDLEDHDRAREHIARTSERARSWIGELAGGTELEPGQAVRRSTHENPTSGGGSS
jgi:PAS domain S-box-containing protein